MLCTHKFVHYTEVHQAHYVHKDGTSASAELELFFINSFESHLHSVFILDI